MLIVVMIRRNGSYFMPKQPSNYDYPIAATEGFDLAIYSWFRIFGPQ
jgi:hypothetical protein